MAVSKNGGTHHSNLDQFTIETLQYACVYTCIYNHGEFLIIMEVSKNGGTHHSNLDQFTIETLQYACVYIYITLYIYIMLHIVLKSKSRNNSS
jgi:hypothetical protein